MRKLAYIISSLSVFAVNFAHAQGLNPPNSMGGVGLPGSPSSTITGEISYFLGLALGIVGLLAVAFLIYGGFRYITSAGNDEVAESAKKIITNSIIGLIVIILSYVIVTVIINAIAFNRV